MLIPRVSLLSATDVTTIATPATSLLVYNIATAGTAPNNVTPGFYYWNAKWYPISNKSQLVAFSTGTILSGASVVSALPVLMGFGSHTVETINGSGQSTNPPEAAGFSFPIPFTGVIQNLQVSADLLVGSTSAINSIGLQYVFEVFISNSFLNAGTDHAASPYVTTTLTSAVNFGFPFAFLTPGNFRAATNINTGSIVVNPGDRVGIRIRTSNTTDPSASDINQLSFSASFSYTPLQ